MESQNDHNHSNHSHYGRRNKIAWIALAVGLLALGFAVGSRVSGVGMGRGPMGWQQNNPPQWQQGQFPNAPQPPQAAQPPSNQAIPRGPMGWQRGQDGPMFGEQHGPRGHMMGGGGRGGFIGIIFGIISGIFKLAFWGIALFLIIKVLRDRRGGRGDQTASRPGPEQPPYTGHTTNL